MQAADAKDAVKVRNALAVPDFLSSGCIAPYIQDCAEGWLARKHICASMQLTVCLCSYQDTFSGADNKADEAGNKAKGERRPMTNCGGGRVQMSMLKVHAWTGALLRLLSAELLAPLQAPLRTPRTLSRVALTRLLARQM